MGKDKDGLCCSGKIDPATNQCSGTCKTRFRVCLKNYQAKIDMTSPCTFGDVMTPVVGENSMNLTALTENMDFVNPIRFPFDFTWPVSTAIVYINMVFWNGKWFWDSKHRKLIQQHRQKRCLALICDSFEMDNAIIANNSNIERLHLPEISPICHIYIGNICIRARCFHHSRP